MPPIQLQYQRKDLPIRDVPYKRSRDTFKVEEKTESEKKSNPQKKYIAFICISAHNSVSNNTDAIRNAAATIAKQSYTHMGCIQSGFLYRHSEKAEKELRQLLQGKEPKLSGKEEKEIDKESHRRDTAISTKFVKAAVDAGLSECKFAFYLANDTRSKISKNVENKLDEAANALKVKLEEYGFTIEAQFLEKACKTRGPYKIYPYPPINIEDKAKKSAVDKLFQQLKNATSHYLRQKIPAIPQGNFFDTLTGLIIKHEKLCLTSQWAELIANQTFADYKKAVEQALKTNAEFKADFDERLKTHTTALTKTLLNKLIQQLKLPPDCPLSTCKLIEAEKIVEKYEREFILEEVAGLLACLMATKRAGAIPVMLYPFKMSEAGKLIFELVNNFYNDEIEWRDITSVLQEQDLLSPISDPNITPLAMRKKAACFTFETTTPTPAPVTKAMTPKASTTDKATAAPSPVVLQTPIASLTPASVTLPAQASTRTNNFKIPPLNVTGPSTFFGLKSPPPMLPKHPTEEKTATTKLLAAACKLPKLTIRTQSNVVGVDSRFFEPAKEDHPEEKVAIPTSSKLPKLASRTHSSVV